MLYWTESYDQSFRNQITYKFILCLDHQKTLTTESNLVEIVHGWIEHFRYFQQCKKLYKNKAIELYIWHILSFLVLQRY